MSEPKSPSNEKSKSIITLGVVVAYLLLFVLLIVAFSMGCNFTKKFTLSAKAVLYIILGLEIVSVLLLAWLRPVRQIAKWMLRISSMSLVVYNVVTFFTIKKHTTFIEIFNNYYLILSLSLIGCYIASLCLDAWLPSDKDADNSTLKIADEKLDVEVKTVMEGATSSITEEKKTTSEIKLLTKEEGDNKNEGLSFASIGKVAAMVIVLWVVWNVMDEVVHVRWVMHPFTVPKELTDRGFTGELAAEKFRDGFINMQRNSSAVTDFFKPPGTIDDINKLDKESFKIEVSGISLEAPFSYIGRRLKNLGGIETYDINASMVLHQDSALETFFNVYINDTLRNVDHGVYQNSDMEDFGLLDRAILATESAVLTFTKEFTPAAYALFQFDQGNYTTCLDATKRILDEPKSTPEVLTYASGLHTAAMIRTKADSLMIMDSIIRLFDRGVSPTSLEFCAFNVSEIASQENKSIKYYTAAIEIYKLALNQSDNDMEPTIQANIGWCYYWKAIKSIDKIDTIGAIEYFKLAIQSHKLEIANVCNGLGMISLLNKNYLEAEKQFDIHLRDFPNDIINDSGVRSPEFDRYIGWINDRKFFSENEENTFLDSETKYSYNEKGKTEISFDSASKIFEQAEKMGNGFYLPYFNHAVLCFHKKKYEKANELFEKVQKLSPYFILNYVYWSDNLAAKGDYRGATSKMRTAIDNDTYNPALHAKMAHLWAQLGNNALATLELKYGELYNGNDKLLNGYEIDYYEQTCNRPAAIESANYLLEVDRSNAIAKEYLSAVAKIKNVNDYSIHIPAFAHYPDQPVNGWVVSEGLYYPCKKAKEKSSCCDTKKTK